MRYIVICKDQSVFCTDWYNSENVWSDAIYCIVDFVEDKATFDGVNWKSITFDHL